MWNAVRDRIRFVEEAIASSRIVKVCLAGWGFLAAYDLFMSQIAPSEWTKKAPKLRELITLTSGFLPLWAWLITLSLILSYAFLEFSFRKEKLCFELESRLRTQANPQQINNDTQRQPALVIQPRTRENIIGMSQLMYFVNLKKSHNVLQAAQLMSQFTDAELTYEGCYGALMTAGSKIVVSLSLPSEDLISCWYSAKHTSYLAMLGRGDRMRGIGKISSENSNHELCLDDCRPA